VGRILSIDYGVRRTGLAVTDPLQIIAGGLTTVETSSLTEYLRRYTSAEKVERFVVGLPKQTNGKDSDNLLIPAGGIKLFKYGADAAALFRHDFGSFDLETGASYTVYKPNLRANNEWAKEKNINEYGAGLNIGIGNWSVGGSYHYTNMSRETAEFLNPYANVAKGSSWDAGVKFSAGPFAASANVFQSRADSLTVDGKKDIFSMYQLSAQYKILAGVDVFADLAYLDFKSASDERGLSNKGPAVAIGMNLNF